MSCRAASSPPGRLVEDPLPVGATLGDGGILFPDVVGVDLDAGVHEDGVADRLQRPAEILAPLEAAEDAPRSPLSVGELQRPPAARSSSSRWLKRKVPISGVVRLQQRRSNDHAEQQGPRRLRPRPRRASPVRAHRRRLWQVLDEQRGGDGSDDQQPPGTMRTPPTGHRQETRHQADSRTVGRRLGRANSTSDRDDRKDPHAADEQIESGRNPLVDASRRSRGRGDADVLINLPAVRVDAGRRDAGHETEPHGHAAAIAARALLQ